MAMHNNSALNALKTSEKPYDVVRSAIVAWYYTIYESASAMTLAASGGNAEQHAKTARIWHADIVRPGLAIGPFGLHVNTLVANDVKSEIKTLRNGSNFRLARITRRCVGRCLCLRKRHCWLREMEGRRACPGQQRIQIA